jgi:pantoate--beta-alanine ligase
VNPAQFGAGEDFDAYPRQMDADVKMLGAEGVDVVFTPTTDVMYLPGAQVTVDPGPLARRWEGETRPGHFTGVATVVAKLFNIVRPDLAFFGEKDYQQLRIVMRLAADLDSGVGVVGCPIQRDTDGLALSSRNAYLTPEERAAALAIPGALAAAEQALAWGERDGRALEASMRALFEEAGEAAEVRLDYAAVVDPDTLEPQDRVEGTARALVAAWIGRTRLIDNCELKATS